MSFFIEAVRGYVDSMVETDLYFSVRAQAIYTGRLDSAWDTRYTFRVYIVRVFLYLILGRNTPI